MTEESCIFCNKKPENYVFRAEHFFVLFDEFPVRRGHLLVVPFRHVTEFVHLHEIEFCELYHVIKRVDQLLRTEFLADGYNVGINVGKAAGQTVSHLHIHVIPRQDGDIPKPQGGIRNFYPNPLVQYPTKSDE